MNSTRFQAVDYENFDLPDQQTGKESRRFALDHSQDFSLAANYLFINSENFTNPLKINLSKTLSFRKLYLIEYAFYGVPVTGDIPNFSHYDISFKQLNGFTCQNWIHINCSCSDKFPVLLDSSDVTHRIFNPPRLITEIGVNEMKYFQLSITDPLGNPATCSKIALIFYATH